MPGYCSFKEILYHKPKSEQAKKSKSNPVIMQNVCRGMHL